MANKTPTQLPVSDLGAIDDSVAFVIDDANQSTRKLTLAQLRDALGNIGVTGDVIGSGPFDALVLAIASGAVTLAQMANLGTAQLIGRSTAGPGAPESLSVGPGLSISAGVLDTVTGQTASDASTLLDFTQWGGF